VKFPKRNKMNVMRYDTCGHKMKEKPGYLKQVCPICSEDLHIALKTDRVHTCMRLIDLCTPSLTSLGKTVYNGDKEK
jgi:hypothetical protein